MRSKILVAWITAALQLAGVAALAQADPSPPTPTDDGSRRVLIREVSVTGSTLLPPASLARLRDSLKGQRSIAELQDGARQLQELYREAGFGSVVAWLPEQQLADGQLVIAVCEGRIARVDVVGNQRFSVENVRSSLPQLVTGQTPQVRQIDAQVQLANDHPARRLAVTLEAGAEPGEVDARISVSEEPAARWSVSADNTGNAQTGRLRLALGYQNAALFDRDHLLSLQLQVAPDNPSAVHIVNGSYRIPLYAAGLMYSVYGAASTVDAGSTATAAGALQFNGKGHVLGMSLSRILERSGEFEQRLTLSIDWRDYLNRCAIQGLPDGACGSAGESISVQPLTLDWSAQQGGNRPIGLTLSLSRNLGAGGSQGDAARFAAVRPGAARHYSVARLSAFTAAPLPRDWRWSARLAAQAAAGGLVSGEQFGLAGSSAVRGYEERELAGDSGWVASLEALSPGMEPAGLRLAAFADAGAVRNRLDTACLGTDTHCALAAWGLGLRYEQGLVRWKLDLAEALRQGRSTARHSARVHVQASLSFQ